MLSVGCFERHGEEKYAVLFLGRNDPQKGSDVTLHSFAKATVSHPKALLVQPVRKKTQMCNLLKRWLETGIADRVLFTGFLESKARLTALVDSDVFILTLSSEEFRNRGRRSDGGRLPVIVSDRVGIAEDLRRGRAGVVVSLDL